MKQLVLEDLEKIEGGGWVTGICTGTSVAGAGLRLVGAAVPGWGWTALSVVAIGCGGYLLYNALAY